MDPLSWLTACVLLFVLLATSTWTSTARAHETNDSQTLWQLDRASETATRAHVTMHFEPHLRDSAHRMLERAPTWWTSLEDKLGRDVDDQVTIWFVDHPKQIAQATGMPQWVAGVAHGGRGEIAIAAHSPDGSLSQLDNLLRHEMAHVILHRVLEGRRVPRWLNEGIADSTGAEIDFDRSETLSQALFAGLGGGLPTLANIDAAFAGEPETVSVAYATSRDFVEYLRYRNGDSNDFHYLLGQLRRGHDLSAAVQHAFGTSLSQLEQEWRAGLALRLLGPAMLGEALPLVLVVPLVGAAWIRRRRHLARSWARMRDTDEINWAYGWQESADSYRVRV